jgi:hypothetical protein
LWIRISLRFYRGLNTAIIHKADMEMYNTWTEEPLAARENMKRSSVKVFPNPSKESHIYIDHPHD